MNPPFAAYRRQTKLECTADVLYNYAVLLDEGTASERETAQVLHTLVLAIRTGRTAELETYLEPLVEKWLLKSMKEEG
jgi:hypothetical protein